MVMLDLTLSVVLFWKMAVCKIFLSFNGRNFK
jgi:hypothetical protein